MKRMLTLNLVCFLFCCLWWQLEANPNRLQHNLIKNKYVGNISEHHVFSQEKDTNGIVRIPSEVDWDTYPIEPGNLIIITISEYENCIRDYVQWKRITGKKVHVCIRNRGEWNTEDVKDSIRSHFHDNGENYLLIIGGINEVPNINNSDYYYGLISDSTSVLPVYLPRLCRGRIPMRTRTDVEIVLNKLIQYESNPTTNESFYQTGLHCAEFIDGENMLPVVPPRPQIIVGSDGYEDKYYTLLSEEIKNHLTSGYDYNVKYVYKALDSVNPTHWDVYRYSIGDTIPQHLLRNNYLWNGNTDSIVNQINEGALYVLYQGAGNINGWGSPSLSSTDIQQLENGNKLPIVFSISDSTGLFYSPDSTSCFSEELLKKENGGCVAVFAPTGCCDDGSCGTLALAMFDAIWPPIQLHYGGFMWDGHNGWDNSYWLPLFPVYELGRILDHSLLKLTDLSNLSNSIPHEWYTFHCFGDPSMQIYTRTPQFFEEPLIFSKNDSIFVRVIDGRCQISFYNTATGESIVYSGFEASYPNPSEDLIICLKRHNYIPYVWDFSKDVYIQDESIINETRIYNGNIIHIGKEVTPRRPFGDVMINNSQIEIYGKELKLKAGTTINSNFIFRNQ